MAKAETPGDDALVEIDLDGTRHHLSWPRDRTLPVSGDIHIEY